MNYLWQKLASKTLNLGNPTRNAVPCGGMAALCNMRLEETRPCRLVAYLRHAWMCIWLPITTLRQWLSVVLPRQRVSDTPHLKKPARKHLRFPSFQRDAYTRQKLYEQLYGNSCLNLSHSHSCLIIIATTTPDCQAHAHIFLRIQIKFISLQRHSSKPTGVEMGG